MSDNSDRCLPVDRCVVFLLGKAFQRVSQKARERLGPHGISPVQYVVLSALWEQDRQSGAELTARLRIDSATITGIIDRLVGAGLVQRAPDTQDRRVNRVQLTEAGRSLRSPLEAAMLELNEETAASLGEWAEPFWSSLVEVGLPGAGDDRATSRAE